MNHLQIARITQNLIAAQTAHTNGNLGAAQIYARNAIEESRRAW